METTTEIKEAQTEVAEVVPPVRKSRIEDWFIPNFITLLQQAPNNPIIRGWMLRTLKVMPPQSCDTYESIKDWIEFNMERKVLPAETPLPRARERTFDILIEGSESEFGRCRYQVTRSGIITYSMPLSDVREFITETVDEGGDVDDVLSKIIDAIGDDVWDHLEPDQYGDYEHDDYDYQGSDDSEWDVCSRADLKNNIRELIREMELEDEFGL